MKLYHYCDIFRSLDSLSNQLKRPLLMPCSWQEPQDATARDANYVAQLQHKTLNTFPARPMAPPINPMTLERAVCAAPPDPVNDGSRGHPQLCARPCIRIAKEGGCNLGDACGYCHLGHLSHGSRVAFDKRQRTLLHEMETVICKKNDFKFIWFYCVRFSSNLSGVGQWLSS